MYLATTKVLVPFVNSEEFQHMIRLYNVGLVLIEFR